MKTVSTKLDAKSHDYLMNVANSEGTTVSDFLRNMVDHLIQNESRPVVKDSDDSRRRQISELESTMDNLDRLEDTSIPEHKKAEYVHKMSDIEKKLSSLLDEEYDSLEGSLLDVLGHRSWFSHGDKFLEYVGKYNVPTLEALDDAMGRYLEHNEM